MTKGERYGAYDRLAWFYNRYWGERYHGGALPVLEKLLLSGIPPGARILDLCCGTGHLSRILADRGYQVTGIDGSEEMLRFARINAPGSEFLAFDARSFALPPNFRAVVSTFDSLNHVMRLEELLRVFRNAFQALEDGGLLVFDLNVEEAYLSLWDRSSAIVEPDNVCIVRGGYDPVERIGRSDITMFTLDDEWRRSDVTLFQRCYARGEVEDALREAGFEEAASFDARKDLGMPGDIAVGRAFFRARKTSRAGRSS